MHTPMLSAEWMNHQVGLAAVRRQICRNFRHVIANGDGTCDRTWISIRFALYAQLLVNDYAMTILYCIIHRS